MLSVAAYLRIVRASAAYDLLVTAPFATPWSLALFLQAMARLSAALKLPRPPPVYSIELGFFANLMGSVVIVWSIARLLGPSVRLGRLDALARVLFASWMIYAAAHGASSLLLGFLPIELGFGLAQLAPVRRAAA